MEGSMQSRLWFGIFVALQQATDLLSNQIASLVDITTINSSIIVDVRYATPNNFTKQKIYTSSVCLLHKNTALALDAVQKDLAKKNLGLKIWDGYRPMTAQKKLWSICPDPKYVCPPEKGGRHTRGTAVDVTLVDLTTNKELSMPTEFDNFTQKAWCNYQDLPQNVINNRALLHSVMLAHGFLPIKTEWWHFDLKGWQQYPIID